MPRFNCPECDEEMEISPRMIGKTIRCVRCEAKVVVPDEEERRPTRKRRRPARPERSWSDLRQIAWFQKGILLCILAYITAVGVQFAIPPHLRFVLLVVVIPVALAASVFVFLVAIKLYDVGLGVLFGILTLIPLIGLIMLLVINSRATAVLQENGIHVGLLGARISDLAGDDDDDDER